MFWFYISINFMSYIIPGIVQVISMYIISNGNSQKENSDDKMTDMIISESLLERQTIEDQDIQTN